MELTGRRGRRGKKLLNDLQVKERIFKIERQSTTSHFVENSFWKKL
jgi:hypothetical protein